MRSRLIAVAASTLLLAAGLAACGGGSNSTGSGAKELTYWASNQGSSINQDKSVLGPELKKFQKQTGIKVKVEVISWSDLLNRILAATTSGKGPDVLNVGNTWSASLQATGAFQQFDKATLDKVGGRKRFVPSTLTATGADGKDPGFVPLYGLSYGLIYNKKMFHDAGIAKPPANWAEFLSDAKKMTDPAEKKYGAGILGGSYTENAHFAFMFGKQHGAKIFDGDKPEFDSPQMVDAVKQYVDLVDKDKVVNPSDVELTSDTQNTLFRNFADGKVGMLMFQNNAENNLQSMGLKQDDYGVAPIPMISPLPPGGQKVNSHVAGINIGVFKNSGNKSGALKFIKFMTSPDEQKILNKAFHSLPVTPAAYDDPAFQTAHIKTFKSVLANTAAPLPNIKEESQFETLMGNAIKDLLADAASGKGISEAQIKSKLSSANQQMASAG